MRVAVIGAGGWGTALSILAARAGCEVRVWSRNAAVVEEINGRRVNGAYLPSQEIPAGVRATCDSGEALRGAEAAVVCTEWNEYRNLDWERAAMLMSRLLVVDGRNLYSPTRMRELGFEYYSFGREAVQSGVESTR